MIGRAGFLSPPAPMMNTMVGGMTMYRISVPVTNWFPNRTLDREATLSELRRVGAARVWLCSARGIEGEARLAEEEWLLIENRVFFEENGLEVGVWISSLGHGGALIQDDPDALKNAGAYRRMVGMNGTTCDDTFCPSDETFVRDYTDWVGRIAATGAKLIMLDDDYRLCVRANGNGCCCEYHMREYERRVGRKVARAELKSLVFGGAACREREAWLDMGNEALMTLARTLRRRVDEINPHVRLGISSVLSTWDVDGVDPLALSRAFAGGTRPFLRLSGAPYWKSRGFQGVGLGPLIEVNRMELSFLKDADIELFAEGDTYPRPRFETPASHLEVFDQALRTEARADGILRYTIDYTASPRYERGYADAMQRNAPVYRWLEAHMRGGEFEGTSVLCRPHRLRDADLPSDIGLDELVSRFFFSSAQRLLCDNSLPITYGGRGPHVVFGENGSSISEEALFEGVLLDMDAARLLMARGVDVGIAQMSEEREQAGEEHFEAENEFVATTGAPRFREIVPRPGARVLSRIAGHPACFLYENARGQRFAVYPFDMWRALSRWGMTRGYCRQRQLIQALEWVGRRPLVAVCPGYPDLYLLVKRTEEGLAVGMWNLSDDFVINPSVTMGESGTVSEVFGCEAVCNGRTVCLKAGIAPYSFAGFVVH